MEIIHQWKWDFNRKMESYGNGSENVITLTSEIVSLADGLSAVRYEGDDGFQDFLEQGGASSNFGISGQTGFMQASELVGGVFAGTYFWWGFDEPHFWRDLMRVWGSRFYSDDSGIKTRGTCS